MGSLKNIRPMAVLRAGGEDVVLRFLGDGTTWEAATPTINPSGGSLGAITVDNDTHAHATYTPPGAAATITFTDVTDGSTTFALTVQDALPIYGKAPEVDSTALSTKGWRGHLVQQNS